MAGLCEACSHVGEILFACETVARIHNSRTCTQDQNKWLVPSYVKKIPYLPISDVDFSSAKCKYRKLTENRTATSSSCEPGRVPVPDQVETNNFFEAISQSKQKPVILSVVHPFNQSFKPKGSKLPPPLLFLYQEENIGLDHDHLLENRKKIITTISEEESQQIESVLLNSGITQSHPEPSKTHLSQPEPTRAIQSHPEPAKSFLAQHFKVAWSRGDSCRRFGSYMSAFENSF